LSSTSIQVICPACGSENTGHHSTYNGHALKRCNVCSFVFTAERNFQSGQYDDVYSGVTAYQMMIEDARLTQAGAKGFRHLWWFKKMALKWLRALVPNGRLLDLGSGPGTLLMVARRDFGYQVQGVEPASNAAAIANSYGVPTYCGTVEEFQSRHPNKFDAITSFEVLEHVPDPLSFIRAARKLLKQDGLLILSVPNLDDPYCLKQQITPTMPPIHINFFSRKSIERLLSRSGFTIRRTYTLPIPTSSVRNIYGRIGFLMRLPYLAVSKLIGNQDGTTLLVMATPSDA
jgi:2-polyprenyl-3-methyl-5-hydroxy-6-metoxy-1,4-benzoquinol methylase